MWFILELKFSKISPVNIIKIPAKKIMIFIKLLLINSLWIAIKQNPRITKEGINNGIITL